MFGGGGGGGGGFFQTVVFVTCFVSLLFFFFFFFFFERERERAGWGYCVFVPCFISFHWGLLGCVSLCFDRCVCDLFHFVAVFGGACGSCLLC